MFVYSRCFSNQVLFKRRLGDVNEQQSNQFSTDEVLSIFFPHLRRRFTRIYIKIRKTYCTFHFMPTLNTKNNYCALFNSESFWYLKANHDLSHRNHFPESIFYLNVFYFLFNLFEMYFITMYLLFYIYFNP